MFLPSIAGTIAGWMAPSLVAFAAPGSQAMTQQPADNTLLPSQCSVYDAGGFLGANERQNLYSPISIATVSASTSSAISGPPDIPEADLRAAIARNPSDTASYYKLISLLGKTDRQPEAIALIQQQIEIDPENPYLYTGLADLLVEQTQIGAAITALHAAIEKLPDQAYDENTRPLQQSLYIEMGDLLQVQGKEAEALENYQKGMIGKFSAFDSNVGILGYRAEDEIDYQLEVNPAQSERIYRSLIQSAPNFPFGYYRLVELLTEQGRYDEAITIYKTWIPLNNDPEPFNDSAFNNDPSGYLRELTQQQADYLREQGNFDAALAIYRSLVPKVLPQPVNRAPSLAEESLAPSESFLSIDSFTSLDIAETLVEKGDLQAAAEAYQQLILQASPASGGFATLNPSSHYGKLNIALGDVLTCQGKLAGAEAAYKITAAEEGLEPLGYYYLGNLYADQENLPAAAAAYREVLAVNQSYKTGMLPPNALQQYDALLQQQQWSAAISLYQSLVFDSNHYQ